MKDNQPLKTHGSLFSGIGGFDLAAEWAGIENVFHCEENNFCQSILKHHYPKSILHEDIRTTDFSVHRGAIDVLTGGFPCQNISIATNAKIGIDEEKSGLWRQMLRAAAEIQPRFIIAENSHLLLKRGFEKILYEFSNIGYDAEWCCVQGFELGLSQRRKRVFVIFYPIGFGNWLQERKICTGWNKLEHPAWGNSKDRIYGMANGIPNRVDRHRALGNSLIPQIPFQIFKHIQNILKENEKR